MSHLSGNFSHASAGRLTVTLSGTFFQGTARDAGFPSTVNGEGNVLVRAFIGVSGSYHYTEPIDRFAPTATTEVDYPGGNVVWNLGTEEIAHVNPSGGIWNYGIKNLTINAKLVKK